MAILRYLARKYKVADHWYADDLKVVTLRRTGKPMDEAELTEKIERFDKSLRTIEKVFLIEDKEYVASEEINIANICSDASPSTRTDVLANHPKLAAWKERVEQRLRPDYDDVFKDLFEFDAKT
ncbi:glutathione S-transferase theta-1-like [Acanthaster planci]|uniref:Glutathione S-transferase theta-1-like n=1 Tax=Acanthaster planci TaxID=133434 RepID=A0A8B7XZB1_ACAPL|nr:glutathione S-transferase theta-1-like [Acanthaster planci]